MQDSKTLRESKVTPGCKVMVVGSTVSDIMSITAPDPKQLKEEEKAAEAASKEKLSAQKVCTSEFEFSAIALSIRMQIS